METTYKSLTNESTHTFQSRASLALKRWSFTTFESEEIDTSMVDIWYTQGIITTS